MAQAGLQKMCLAQKVVKFYKENREFNRFEN